MNVVLSMREDCKAVFAGYAERRKASRDAPSKIMRRRVGRPDRVNRQSLDDALKTLRKRVTSDRSSVVFGRKDVRLPGASIKLQAYQGQGHRRNRMHVRSAAFHPRRGNFKTGAGRVLDVHNLADFESRDFARPQSREQQEPQRGRHGRVAVERPPESPDFVSREELGPSRVPARAWACGREDWLRAIPIRLPN